MAKSNRVLRSSSATANHDDRGRVPFSSSYDPVNSHNRASSPHTNSSKLRTAPSFSLTTKPPSLAKSHPPSGTLAPTPPVSDAAPPSRARTCSLPPRGYLRTHQLKKIQSRASARTLDQPTFLEQQLYPLTGSSDLFRPFRILQEGGSVYICYIVTALLALFFGVTLIERIVLTVTYSSALWNLPIAVAPFFRILTPLILRVLVMPIAFGILAVPVRILEINGSLDLTSLIEATPLAVKRCCSTSWLIALKLLRRLIVVVLFIESVELLAQTEPAFSGLSLVTVTGAVAYLIYRATLLCAPLLAIVANYGRRYAIQQVAVILQPVAKKIRVSILCFCVGWFSAHLFLRSSLPFLGLTAASTVFWINAAAWSWYGITYISSVVLNYCALYEQDVTGTNCSV